MANESRRARSSIVSAFNRLVLSRRRSKPKVAEVLQEAGVARSTFYEHFDSRDSLLVEAMKGPLGAVADAAAGTGGPEPLVAILDHFKDHKREAAELLAGPLAPRIVRVLATLIEERLESGGFRRNAALHLADIQIGFIRLWLTGETPYAPAALAETMIESATAQRRAFSLAIE